MNFNNRRRSIYVASGLKQQPPQNETRRQNSDLFERDPFKIQSFNFHYVDKPRSPPLQNTFNRNNNNNRRNGGNNLHTYYYNQGFAAAERSKESTADKFHEQRRRKFLYDSRQVTELLQPLAQSQSRPRPANPYVNETRPSIVRTAAGTTTPLPRNGGNRRGECVQGIRAFGTITKPHHTNTPMVNNRQRQVWQQQPPIACTTSSSSRSSLAARGVSHYAVSSGNEAACSNSQSSMRQQTECRRSHDSAVNIRASAQSLVSISKSRAVVAKSSCTSGCQININIKGLDESKSSENVTIEIESDRHKFNQVQAAELQSNPSYTQQKPKTTAELRRNASYTQQVMRPTLPNKQSTSAQAGAMRTFAINEQRSSRHSLAAAADSRSRIAGDRGDGSRIAGNRGDADSHRRVSSPACSAKERRPSLISWNIEVPSTTEVREHATTSTKKDASNTIELNRLQAGVRNLEASRSRRDLTTAALDTAQGPGGMKRQNSTLSMRSCMNMSLRLKPELPNERTNGLMRCSDTRMGRAGGRFTGSSYQQDAAHRRSPSPVNVNINVYTDNARMLRL